MVEQAVRERGSRDSLACTKQTEEEKANILHKLSNNLTKEGEMVISAQSSRSQSENKNNTKEKLDELLDPKSQTEPGQGSGVGGGG